MSEVMVSIFVPTYNHEKYIVQALDSILMQKTQYSYEVFVGEDCSTDNTRQVLKEWELAHPGKFTILYREKNMNKELIYNSLDLKLRCKGKYIIGLEGDDFWTDPEKLEKQVAFLENHPEYYAVAHNCTVVGEDSTPNGEVYPECKDSEYTLRHFASNIMPGQLTTVLSKNYMTDETFDNTLATSPYGPGDRNIYFSMVAQKRVYCMQERMTAYRHITSGGSSFSATNVFRYEKDKKPLWHRIEFAKKHNNREALRYANFLYLMNIRYALLARQISISAALADARKVEKWPSYLSMMLKRDFNRFVLHKTPYV